jgi:hypothetical protein
LNLLIYHHPRNDTLLGEFWPIFINGQKIHSYLQSSLYEEIYRSKMSLHWERKQRMTTERSILVNWPACASAMQRLKISRRHWIAKHSEGMCGVGKWLVIWKEREHPDCPRCSAFEDAQHVWNCPSPEATLIRTTGISTLSSWMEDVQTATDINQAITTRLTQWSAQLPFTPIPLLTEDTQAAVAAQDDIGWDNFFEGRVAKDWEYAQDSHYKWCKSRRSGRRWTISLIQKLWDIAWDLWENRNDMLYAKENAEALHGMDAVDDDIHRHFQRGPVGLLPNDQALLSGSVNDVLSTPIFYRQRWLLRMDNARSRANRRQADTYQAERQLFAAWLHGDADHVG